MVFEYKWWLKTLVMLYPQALVQGVQNPGF